MFNFILRSVGFINVDMFVLDMLMLVDTGDEKELSSYRAFHLLFAP